MKKNAKKIFGYELVLDLFECDEDVITSDKKLKQYVDQLCEVIKMQKYGKTLLPYFGEKEIYTKGYSHYRAMSSQSHNNMILLSLILLQAFRFQMQVLSVLLSMVLY